jgi:hypothetical protein
LISLPTYRDIILVSHGGDIFITAVDSCGAIGEKPQDAVSVPSDLAGEFTARVALLEVLCAGAQPMFVSVSVCNEPKTAQKVLEGVRRALGNFSDIPVVISTEKNMATLMTAFGVTVVGICKNEGLRLEKAQSGDQLFCAGLPLVGGETLKVGAPLFTLDHLEKLTADSRVHAVIPCGSRGAAAEANVLADENRLHASLFECSALDLRKSAGPASCAVFAANVPDSFDFGLDIPVACIGKLI